MQQTDANSAPHLLTDKQKQNWVNTYQDVQETLQNDLHFSKVITDDETWVYGYKPETKQWFSLWKSPTSPQ
jgi:hypothetical protein